MSCDIGERIERLENELCSFSNPSFASLTSQALHLIHLASRPCSSTSEYDLQCMSRAHSPTFPSLHLRHNSFSNPSVGSPTSQFILQHLFRFSCSFSKPFRHFTYVTTHSLTLPSLHLRHNSFSNPFVALSTSQLILQPFFSILVRHTSSSLNSPGAPPMVPQICRKDS